MKAWLLTLYVVLFVVLVLAFTFSIIAYSRTNTVSKNSSNSEYPGTNVYVSGVSAAPKVIFVNSDTILNGSVIPLGPENNGMTFYITGSTSVGINFNVANNNLIPDGYYINIVNSVIGQNIIIGTNTSGAQTNTTIIPSYKALVCKKVAIVTEVASEPTLFSGVIQVP
jgi:hypothetical protein